jgi:hypothetical protein
MSLPVGEELLGRLQNDVMTQRGSLCAGKVRTMHWVAGRAWLSCSSLGSTRVLQRANPVNL